MAYIHIAMMLKNISNVEFIYSDLILVKFAFMK